MIDLSSAAVREELTEGNAAQMRQLKRIAESLEGEGLRLTRCGLIQKATLELWQGLGIDETASLTLADKIGKLALGCTRSLWHAAAKALHEEDVRNNPRLSNPRQAMDEEIADILMTQAQDGVVDWEEAERKLSRTTGTKKRAWVQRWKAAREEGKSIEASAKEANKELEADRRMTRNGGEAGSRGRGRRPNRAGPSRSMLGERLPR